MNDKLPSPILITGCARSGTSMIAGTINLCGAFGGTMSGPNSNNQKGMFENVKIRDAITKPYLRILGVDPKVQYPLPNIDNLPIPNDWRDQIEEVMLKQGYNGGPWFYKGAKMASMWPVWHHAFPNAKWVIVRRRTGDIIDSCCKTGFMRAFQRKDTQLAVGAKNQMEGWLWWVHEHEKRFVEMISAGLNVKVIWPNRMVHRDYAQMHETIEWLGLPWTNEIYGFIDPLLWHSRKKEKITGVIR